MSRPAKALALAIVSLVLCPVLLWVEVIALMISAMVVNEDANSLPVKVASVAFVVLLGLLALTLPAVSLVWGNQSRAATRPEGVQRSSPAVAALVIGGLALAGVVLGQISLVLWALGILG